MVCAVSAMVFICFGYWDTWQMLRAGKGPNNHIYTVSLLSWDVFFSRIFHGNMTSYFWAVGFQTKRIRHMMSPILAYIILVKVKLLAIAEKQKYRKAAIYEEETIMTNASLSREPRGLRAVMVGGRGLWESPRQWRPQGRRGESTGPGIGGPSFNGRPGSNEHLGDRK